MHCWWEWALGKDIFTCDVTLPPQCDVVSRVRKVRCLYVCLAATSREHCWYGAPTFLIRSEEVTPNTSEAIYKLPALNASSYICSRAARHRVHAYRTQYTAYCLHKSISKPHPPAFSSDNTPVIRMDTDCLYRLGYFSAFGSNLKTILKATNIWQCLEQDNGYTLVSVSTQTHPVVLTLAKKKYLTLKVLCLSNSKIWAIKYIQLLLAIW